MQIGEFLLQLDMEPVGAGNVARAAGACATKINRAMHGFDHGGVLTHAEIVIRAPDCDVLRTLLRLHDGTRKLARLPLEIGKDAIASFRLQRCERIGKKVLAVKHSITRHRITLGERVADSVAAFGGSWAFIILFAVSLTIYTVINVRLGNKAWDPYPFILLNLLLSCIAAVQAPIIMMSQKRQEAKDRLRSENDYRVNLKAEFEIRHLHEKLDHLINRQWERLAEIQQIQLEIMEDIAAKRR